MFASVVGLATVKGIARMRRYRAGAGPQRSSAPVLPHGGWALRDRDQISLAANSSSDVVIPVTAALVIHRPAAVCATPLLGGSAGLG